MKRLLMLALALVVIGAASQCFADPAAEAVSHVYLTVNPNIALQAIDANVNMGTTQTGDVTFPITFRIDANTEAVGISGLVTKLYKGDAPNATEVEPIDVNQSAGLVIDPVYANEIAGGSGIASYVSAGSYVVPLKGTFEGEVTEALTFESGQNGHFSQEVEVSPTWKNTDDEKPMGEYSGYVILYATVFGA